MRDALEGGHQEVSSKHLNLSHALEKPIRSYPALFYFYFTFFFFWKKNIKETKNWKLNKNTRQGLDPILMRKRKLWSHNKHLCNEWFICTAQTRVPIPTHQRQPLVQIQYFCFKQNKRDRKTPNLWTVMKQQVCPKSWTNVLLWPRRRKPRLLHSARGGQRGAVPGDPSGPPAVHHGPAASAETQLVLERRG